MSIYPSILSIYPSLIQPSIHLASHLPIHPSPIHPSIDLVSYLPSIQYSAVHSPPLYSSALPAEVPPSASDHLMTALNRVKTMWHAVTSFCSAKC
ncbi:hypothetical protein ECG_07978 [Echinococcus granulosus]|nr:hypothetical protein ECG_07978 [Echinococcus granulosus]